mmetsp:Transcript_45739/g.121295  ORF Transcript_45739/g.121295 Transcript_45739/m.121295 type:complete len:227 (-) Transcript_45739:382-1062(-)
MHSGSLLPSLSPEMSASRGSASCRTASSCGSGPGSPILAREISATSDRGDVCFGDRRTASCEEPAGAVKRCKLSTSPLTSPISFISEVSDTASSRGETSKSLLDGKAISSLFVRNHPMKDFRSLNTLTLHLPPARGVPMSQMTRCSMNQSARDFLFELALARVDGRREDWLDGRRELFDESPPMENFSVSVRRIPLVVRCSSDSLDDENDEQSSDLVCKSSSFSER